MILNCQPNLEQSRLAAFHLALFFSHVNCSVKTVFLDLFTDLEGCIDCELGFISTNQLSDVPPGKATLTKKSGKYFFFLF
jgi:hypothetical protein